MVALRTALLRGAVLAAYPREHVVAGVFSLAFWRGDCFVVLDVYRKYIEVIRLFVPRRKTGQGAGAHCGVSVQ